MLRGTKRARNKLRKVNAHIPRVDDGSGVEISI